jgi:hypothetical protein
MFRRRGCRITTTVQFPNKKLTKEILKLEGIAYELGDSMPENV